jgi:uncharacterized membrane protein
LHGVVRPGRLRQWARHSERGLHRLVAFSDAVVAIAITLLVLPLVDAAGSIGTTGIDTFFHENQSRLLAFALSFVVIGSFWWGQHKLFERVRSYNAVVVWGMFVWLFCIVFLPFPTELLGSAKSGSTTAHGIYVGTMLMAAVAVLIQQRAVVQWPELQDEEHRGSATIDAALVLTVLMGVAFMGVVAVPAIGMWALLILLLSRPLEHLLAVRRTR